MDNGEKTDKKRAVSPINGQPVPNGRTKGVPNKRTAAGREAIAQFVDGNADRLTLWLDQIAEKDPKQAFDAFMSVVEYHIPKLARQELQNLDKDGKPADNKMTIEFVNAPSDTKRV